MITYNGKELRNLEEQVRKNKEDIARHYQATQLPVNLAGITVIGSITDPSELDDKVGEMFGDAYVQVVGDDTKLWIWTRSNPDAGEDTPYWLDIPFTTVGEQGAPGPKGDKGDPGVRGSQWFSGTGQPTTTSGYNKGDYYINIETGNIWHLHEQSGNLVWLMEGNIKGPQGPQGIEGKQGRQGEQGPQGNKGPAGPAGATVQILGTITSIDQLPDPTTVPRNGAYLNTSSSPVYLYVISGTTTLAWTNAGPFNAATMVTQNGEYLTTWDTNIKLDNMDNRTGAYWTTYNKFFDRFYPLVEVNGAGNKNYTWRKAINKSQDGDYPGSNDWQKVQRGDPVVRTASGNIILPPDIDNYNFAAVHKLWVLQNTQPAKSDYHVNGWVTFPNPVVVWAGPIDYPDYTNNEGASDVSSDYADVGNVVLYFNNAIYEKGINESWETQFEFMEGTELSKSAANLTVQFEGEMFPVHNLGYYYDNDSNTECFRIVITYGGSNLLNLMWYMYEGDGEPGYSAEEVFTQPTIEIA